MRENKLEGKRDKIFFVFLFEMILGSSWVCLIVIIEVRLDSLDSWNGSFFRLYVFEVGGSLVFCKVVFCRVFR